MRRASGGGNQSEEHEATSPSGDVPLEEIDSKHLEKQDTVSLDSRDSAEDRASIEDTNTLLLTDDEHLKSSVNTCKMTTKPSYSIRKLLLHGSFYVVGVAVLVAGGVGSLYTPYVDPEDYSNCSSTNFSMNETNYDEFI